MTMRGKRELFEQICLVRNEGGKHRHRLYRKWMDGRNYCLKLQYAEV